HGRGHRDDRRRSGPSRTGRRRRAGSRPVERKQVAAPCSYRGSPEARHIRLTELRHRRRRAVLGSRSPGSGAQLGQALNRTRFPPAACVTTGDQPIDDPADNTGSSRKLQGIANRCDVRCVFQPDRNIGAIIRRQPDQRAANTVIKKVTQARGLRDDNHNQRRQDCDRTDEAGGKEGNNEEAHALEGIGINASPVRRDDADGEHKACGHDGHDERKEDDDNPAKEGHFLPQIKRWGHSTIAIGRSAMRSRTESFSVALLSWPQAARISRPRGVRTGEAYPASNRICENLSICSQSEHSYLLPGHGLNGIRLILAGMPLSSRISAFASSVESFTPLSITYSNVMRLAFETPG